MKRIPPLIPFLVFVFVLFIGILLYTYVEAKRANPQMVPVGWNSGPAPLTLASRTLPACNPSLPGQA
jgi:hypothetical protein